MPLCGSGHAIHRVASMCQRVAIASQLRVMSANWPATYRAPVQRAGGDLAAGTAGLAVISVGMEHVSWPFIVEPWCRHADRRAVGWPVHGGPMTTGERTAQTACSRRRFLGMGATVVAGALLPACGRPVRAVSSATLPATPWSTRPGTVTSLSEEATYLTDLEAATDRVRIVTLGSSARGRRPIRAVIVGPPRTRDQVREANNCMAFGSHHGDEWAGREAIFQHMRDHAAGSSTETIVYLPTVSPDSAVLAQRNLPNSVDPNRLWSPSGVDHRTDGGAYFPEQQCIRQAILLYHPRIVFDTHEYTSTSNIYRFERGSSSASGTSQAVVDVDAAVLTAMRDAATAAGHTTATYGGAIPDDGATQAFNHGGIPAIFTESAQEAAGGLARRRAQQLNSLYALQAYVQANAAALASVAASATWYSGFTPTVTDP
jgi:Zinc carboxypeptidase